MVHGMTLIMIGMTLTSACGTLLFNEDESDILLHRPVPASLILRAKVKVLLTYSGMLALALNAVPLLVGGLRSSGGWAFIPPTSHLRHVQHLLHQPRRPGLPPLPQILRPQKLE